MKILGRLEANAVLTPICLNLSFLNIISSFFLSTLPSLTAHVSSSLRQNKGQREVENLGTGKDLAVSSFALHVTYSFACPTKWFCLCVALQC